MDQGHIGGATITRIHETLIVEDVRSFFPAFDAQALKPHETWLAPHHYQPDQGTIKMPVHSWLVQTQTRTILIDTGCGNQKDRLGIPGMHALTTPYIERLHAAGVRCEDVDYVLCTHRLQRRCYSFADPSAVLALEHAILRGP